LSFTPKFKSGDVMLGSPTRKSPVCTAMESMKTLANETFQAY
jgi:hypothetical protein